MAALWRSRWLAAAAAVAAVALLHPGAAAARLEGSAEQDGLSLSCTSTYTCGALDNLAFEGYHFGASQADSRATCLCINGTRVVAAGAAADPTVELQAADGPLLAGGCWANMTWSQAAPFIGACRGDVAAVECSEACVDALAPFNELCFVGVVTDDFLQGSSEAAVLSSQQAEEFYKACFPTSGAGSVRAAGSVLTALAALAGAALLLA